MDIKVSGEIVSNDSQWIYDWLEYESFSPKNLEEQLKNANGEEINLIINSPGGDVISASVIRSSLKAYQGKVIATLTGLAASAASVIMTGADQVKAYPTSLVMIHKASSYAGGNADDLEKTVAMLNEVDKSIANVYVEKTGKCMEEVLNLMADTTWCSPQKAKEIGLVDEILSESPHFLNSFGCSCVTDKMKNLVIESKNKQNNSFNMNKLAECINDVLDKREAIKEEQVKENLLKDLESFGE